MLTINCHTKWDDQQEIKDTQNRSCRRVINRETGEVYNSVFQEDNKCIRIKFFGIATTQTFMVALRPLYRVGAIFSGDWVRTGVAFAKREWELERQAASIQRKASIPGEWSLIGKKVKHCLWQLVKNIIKAVTYPLAAVGIIFACLYGALVNIHTGREWISKIENLWARDLLKIQGGWKPLICISDYLAPCMLSQRNYEYIYRLHLIESPGARIRVMQKLNIMRAYYENEGIAVEKIIRVDLAGKFFTYVNSKDKESISKSNCNIFNKIEKELNLVEQAREAAIKNRKKIKMPPIPTIERMCQISDEG